MKDCSGRGFYLTKLFGGEGLIRSSSLQALLERDVGKLILQFLDLSLCHSHHFKQDWIVEYRI